MVKVYTPVLTNTPFPGMHSVDKPIEGMGWVSVADYNAIVSRLVEAERLIYQEISGGVSSSESRRQMTEFLQHSV